MKPERGNPPWWFSTSFCMCLPRGKYEIPWHSMRNSQNHHKITFPHVFPHVFSTSMSYLCWLVVWNIWIIFPYIGNFIIQTDELHHFSEGLAATTNPIIIPLLATINPLLTTINQQIPQRMPSMFSRFSYGISRHHLFGASWSSERLGPGSQGVGAKVGSWVHLLGDNMYIYIFIYLYTYVSIYIYMCIHIYIDANSFNRKPKQYDLAI